MVVIRLARRVCGAATPSTVHECTARLTQPLGDIDRGLNGGARESGEVIPAQEPSDAERAVWMRNQTIDYLELASSYERQRSLEEKIPVAQEIINEWVYFDPVQGLWPGRTGPPFLSEEVEALQRFHTEWTWVCDHIPDPLPWDLDEVHGWPAWERLRLAAEQALTVFERRGKLPEASE